MPAYDLTLAAQADIEEIARYSLDQWGESKARDYAARLDACFDRIAAGHAVCRTVSRTFPQVQATRCERHIVFFLPVAGGKPRIIAVLHERMEMLIRLKDRLP
jgi:toxin ParE1/3/4